MIELSRNWQRESGVGSPSPADGRALERDGYEVIEAGTDLKALTAMDIDWPDAVLLISKYPIAKGWGWSH